MPAWVKDEGTWERAKAKAKEEYPDLEEGDRFYSIVTAIYKKMGGQIGTGKALVVFGKAHVRGHHRKNPKTGEQTYIRPHEDSRPAAPPALPPKIRYERHLEGEIELYGSGRFIGSLTAQKRGGFKVQHWTKLQWTYTHTDLGRFPTEEAAIHALLDHDRNYIKNHRHLTRHEMEEMEGDYTGMTSPALPAPGGPQPDPSPMSNKDAAVQQRDFVADMKELQRQLLETPRITDKLRILQEGMEVTSEFIENAKVHQTLSPERIDFYQRWLEDIQATYDRLQTAHPTVRPGATKKQMAKLEAAFGRKPDAPKQEAAPAAVTVTMARQLESLTDLTPDEFVRLARDPKSNCRLYTSGGQVHFGTIGSKPIASYTPTAGKGLEVAGRKIFDQLTVSLSAPATNAPSAKPKAKPKKGEQISLFKRMKDGFGLFFKAGPVLPQNVPVKAHLHQTKLGKIAFVGPGQATRYKRARIFAHVGKSRDVSIADLQQARDRGKQHWPNDWQAECLEILVQPHVYRAWQKINEKKAGGYRTYPVVRRVHNDKYGHGFVLEWYTEQPNGQIYPAGAWNSVKDEYFAHAPGNTWNGIQRETKSLFVEYLRHLAAGRLSYDKLGDLPASVMHEAMRDGGLRLIRDRVVPQGYAVGDRIETAEGIEHKVIGGEDGYLIMKDQAGRRRKLSPEAITRGSSIRLPAKPMEKGLVGRMCLGLGQLLKAHVKTYTRSDGTMVREHDDKRPAAKVQFGQGRPQGSRLDRMRRRRTGEDQSQPKPQPTTDQPTPQQTPEAEPGRLDEWLHQILQQPDIQEAMREIDNGTPTALLYRQDDGSYTPERARLHDSIIASMLNPRAVAEEGQRPHAVIFMGAPGAGKTTALRPAADDLGVEFTTINSDEVQAKLPEYTGRNAAMLHEEASDIAEGELLGRAIQQNHNVLLDVTGANTKKLRGWVERLHKLGYEVSVMYAALPIEKACARAVDRFRRTGRFVPPNYIAETVDGLPESTYEELKQDPRVSHWRRYNTDVEKGSEAPLQESGKKGQPGVAKGGRLSLRFAGAAGRSAVPGDGGAPQRPGDPDAGRGARRDQAAPLIAKALVLRSGMLKAISQIDQGLASPDIDSAMRGVLLNERLAHLERIKDIDRKLAQVQVLA